MQDTYIIQVYELDLEQIGKDSDLFNDKAPTANKTTKSNTNTTPKPKTALRRIK